jgi:hypothetical protein
MCDELPHVSHAQQFVADLMFSRLRDRAPLSYDFVGAFDVDR